MKLLLPKIQEKVYITSVNQSILDTNRLDSILSQHGLLAKWEQFGHRFFGDDK